MKSYLCKKNREFKIISSCLKKTLKIIQFVIFGCAGSSLLCAGFLQLWGVGATLVAVCELLTVVTSLLWSMGCGYSGCSSCGLGALEHRFSTCGTQAQLLCGMWDLPEAGIEPVSLHCKMVSLTLNHQGKPLKKLLIEVPHT